MGYINAIEKELRDLLVQEPECPEIAAPVGSEEYNRAWEAYADFHLSWRDEVTGYVKGKILESYRNGIRSGSHSPKNQYKKSKTPK